MRAIILAGGFGTRLRSVVSDVPKPLAPIQGKPFLAYVLEYLKAQGITEVILSVHHLRNQIENYFRDEFAGIKIDYAIEETPLGTGGAILHSLKKIKSDEPIFVLNGDTFLKLNYREMFSSHEKNHAELSIALREISDCSRFGVVMTEKNSITSFKEQGGQHPGWINAGVYLLRSDFFSKYHLPLAFSFEKDFLFPNIKTLKPNAFYVKDFFIDIGVPEDYKLASDQLPDVVIA